jgi:hypothetical protein
VVLRKIQLLKYKEVTVWNMENKHLNDSPSSDGGTVSRNSIVHEKGAGRPSADADIVGIVLETFQRISSS